MSKTKTKKETSAMNNNNLTVSYELLYLLQWLLEQDPKALKTLIAGELKNGLHDYIKASTKAQKQENATSSEDLHYNIIDFLALLESVLYETMHEQRLQKIVEKKILPSLNNIDGQECDQATLESSVETATSRIENHPNDNPQEILFKEILKTWKPSKGVMH